VIRIVLADDHLLVRAGLRMLIEHEPDLELVGEATDGRAAVEQVRRELPDVVVMDLSMPELDGVEATRLILGEPSLEQVKVMVLTALADEYQVFAALRAGAMGFCFKDTDPGELLHAIRVVASGGSLLPPGPTRRLIETFVSRPEPSDVIPQRVEWLTERELEVLRLVAAGLSNHDIAARLVVSPATAKTHVSRTMRKLRVHDRSQLVVIAYESGLVAPGHAT
jgi:DNA-binding NarL/FixJ family response regulator